MSEENLNESLGIKRKMLSPKLDVVFQALFGEKESEKITKRFLQSILKEEILSKNS